MVATIQSDERAKVSVRRNLQDRKKQPSSVSFTDEVGAVKITAADVRSDQSVQQHLKKDTLEPTELKPANNVDAQKDVTDIAEQPNDESPILTRNKSNENWGFQPAEVSNFFNLVSIESNNKAKHFDKTALAFPGCQVNPAKNPATKFGKEHKEHMFGVTSYMQDSRMGDLSTLQNST